MYQGRNYAVANSSSLVQSSTLPLVTIIGTSAVRSMIYEYIFGSSGSPADNAVQYSFQRCTTAGTAGSSLTPVALDPGDPAAVSTSGLATFSGGPTLTANLFLAQFGLNQRATFRWIAAPGAELKIPATANNGIAVMPIAVSAGFVSQFTLYIAE